MTNTKLKLRTSQGSSNTVGNYSLLKLELEKKINNTSNSITWCVCRPAFEIKHVLINAGTQTDPHDLLVNYNEEDFHFNKLADGPFNEVLSKILNDDEEITVNRKKPLIFDDFSHKVANMIAEDIKLETGLFRRENVSEIRLLEIFLFFNFLFCFFFRKI